MIERQKQLYLCRPNGEILTVLNGVDTENVEYSVHAKDYNQITFNVYRYINVNGEMVESNGYEDLKVEMNILLEGEDMFKMEEPTIEHDGIKEYKTITAYSIEREFQDKDWVDCKINTGENDSLEYTIDGNRNEAGFAIHPIYIYQPNSSGLTEFSLLHRIIAKVPGWSIDDIDIDVSLYFKQISVDESNINLYALLTSVIGPKAECIFLFDTINKKIKAYAKYDDKREISEEEQAMREEYGQEYLDSSFYDTNIFVSMRNLAQEINVQTDEDSVFTVFNVSGGDNVENIRIVNYNDPYVYDLSYFMSEPWMKQKLVDKIQRWLDWRDEHRSELMELQKEIERRQDEIYDITYQTPNDGDDWEQWDKMEDKLLEENLKAYEQELDLIREGVDPDPAYTDDGEYIHRTTQDGEVDEELYETWLEEKGELKGYLEIRDYVIVNIKIALENKELIEPEKRDYVEEYETEWGLYGISLLEEKEETYSKQMKTLSKYSKPWNDLTDEEKSRYSIEESYNNYHNEYQKYADYLGDYIDDDGNLAYREGSLRYRLKQLRDSVNTKNEEIDSFNEDISALVEKAKIENEEWEMTNKDILLFRRLCIHTDYTNENIIATSLDDTISKVDIQKRLYDDAVSKLSEASQPQYHFNVTMDNFFDLPEFQAWKNNFKLLHFMRVGIRDDYSVKLRLIGYTTNPCELDPMLTVEFSNFITSRSGRSDLTELLNMENNRGQKNSISLGTGDSKDDIEYVQKLFYMMKKGGLLSSAIKGEASGVTTNISAPFAGVGVAQVMELFTNVGMIKDATISNARITGYLDAIEVYGANIVAGTLMADRLIIRGQENSVVWALNNYGDLQGTEVSNDELNGYIVQRNTLHGDRLIAKTITAREITTEKLKGTGGWINLREGTFWFGGGAYTAQDPFVSSEEDEQAALDEAQMSAVINNNYNNYLSWDGSKLAISGTLTARDGNIGGYNVTTLYDIDNVGETTANYGHVFYESLYSHSANAIYEYEVGLTTGQTPAGVGWQLPEKLAFYVERINKDARWDTSTPMFYVRNDGKLFANNVELSGGQIYSSNYSYTSGNYADNGMLIDLSNGLMRSKNLYLDGQGNLSITGTVTATTGKIGCWIISNNEENNGTSEQGGHVFGDNSLYTHSSIAWDATDQKNYQYEVGMKGDSQPGHLAFYVKRIVAGQPWSTAQDIFFVRQNGALRATRGDIGGWTITNNQLYAQANNAATGNVLRTTGFQNPGSGVNAITVGATNYSDWSTAPFYVTHKGELHATSAYITGKVQATTGKIGNWIISDSTNVGKTSANGGHCYNAAMYSHSTDGTYEYEVGMKADTSPGFLAFYVKKITAGQTWNSNNTEDVFYVRHSGAIKATLGDIGGWTISSTALSKGKIGQSGSVFLQPNGTTAAIGGTPRSGLVITAGDNFGVTDDGILYAKSAVLTSANVTGEINATSGKIGSFTINDSGNLIGNDNRDGDAWIVSDGTALFRGKIVNKKETYTLIMNGQIKLSNDAYNASVFNGDQGVKNGVNINLHAISVVDYHDNYVYGQARMDTDGFWGLHHGKITNIKSNLHYAVGTNESDGRAVAVLASNTSNGNYILTVNGQWGATAYTTHSFTATDSDVRLKENIKLSRIKNAIDIINQIKIYQFDWKDTNTHQKIGFVADQLELLDKNLAIGGGYDEDGDMIVKSVNTFYLQGYEVKAIQELSAKIDELEKQIKELKSRI